jgi:putative transposase
MMNLRVPLEKTPDADLLREMTGFAAERLMELEVGAAARASYAEKSPLMIAQRIGYLYREWEMRAGTSSCGFRSSASAPTSLPFWSRAAWRKRR